MLALRFSVLVTFCLLAVATPPPQQGVGVKGVHDADAPNIQLVAPKPAPTVAPVIPKEQPIQQRIIATLQSFVGIKEEPKGSNNGPLINKFNKSAGFLPADHAPWCASVTHYTYMQCGLNGQGAYSPSWYSKARVVSRDKVGPADVGLIYFQNLGRYAHTIAGVEKATFSAGRVVQVTTLEGNTNAQGSREGDQFARRIRPADTVTFVRWWNQ